MYESEISIHTLGESLEGNVPTGKLLKGCLSNVNTILI